uniref:NAD(P)H-quinone oxidoreductase subunit 4L, chloroplastic n=5 Tax=Cynanchum TaxID=126747 RepID=A0A2U7NBN6_9GENT|nr:NADH dehydrogenase subunit 4L [Cynanchum auriculatum]ARR28053.1 NADH dehydrogenase subunit 4L [Cynanchum wilfordii]
MLVICDSIKSIELFFRLKLMRLLRSCLMMLEHVLVLSAYLFSTGIYGLITSRNMVRALMCLELILNAVNINFVTFSYFFDNRQLRGDIFSIFVIAIAAAEAAIGPAIVSSIYRNRKSTRINQSNLLNK